MLSYLHAFHAGNFADVLKHTILIQILDYLNQKEKPYLYFDTHAGAGLFKLQAEESQKNCEYENGIGKLWKRNDLPPALLRYRDIVAAIQQLQDQPSEALTFYPGSPWFARYVSRDHDRMQLCELHPREFETLRKNMQGERRIKLFRENGFQRAIASMPPSSRRGMMLIDPPYEVKTDYQLVVDSVKECYKRFATGTYAIWYPVVKRDTIDKMLDAFKQSGIRNIQVFELGLSKDSPGRGMTSSGMLVINPPWTLKQTMETCLPYLAQTLGGKQGVYKIQQLVNE